MTATDAIRTAERHLRTGRRAEENVRDYLAWVAPYRPARDAQGTPGEEIEISRLARAAKVLHPEISFCRLEREARDKMLWWRWPLQQQVAAWLAARWPFNGGPRR